MIFKSLPNPDF